MILRQRKPPVRRQTFNFSRPIGSIMANSGWFTVEVSKTAVCMAVLGWEGCRYSLCIKNLTLFLIAVVKANQCLKYLIKLKKNVNQPFVPFSIANAADRALYLKSNCIVRTTSSHSTSLAILNNIKD